VKNLGPTRPSDPEYYLVRKSTEDETFQRAEPPTGWRAAYVVARTALDPKLMAVSMRRVLGEIDPTLPVEIESMPRRMDEVTTRPRFNAVLLSVFAAIGVLLAAIGLFGVMSFLVAQRTREIGVRMALGATPRQILQMMLGQAAWWTGAGITIGVAGSVVVSGLLRSLLFGVEPTDPSALAGAVALLGALALFAAAIPAARAARLDPMETLRED
jgi:ABC-type antimicrobial peptide transport system permease subunit